MLMLKILRSGATLKKVRKEITKETSVSELNNAYNEISKEMARSAHRVRIGGLCSSELDAVLGAIDHRIGYLNRKKDRQIRQSLKERQQQTKGAANGKDEKSNQKNKSKKRTSRKRTIPRSQD